MWDELLRSPDTAPVCPAQPPASGVPRKAEGARPSPSLSSQPGQCWSWRTRICGMTPAPCTGPSWRRGNLPPHRPLPPLTEKVKLWCKRVPEGSCLKKKKRALIPLACCNCSLEVVEAAGFEPEMELGFFRYFVSAAARSNYYFCVEPCVWLTVTQNHPESWTS